MVRYLLDSDVCIEALRGRGGNVMRRLRNHAELFDVGMSAVALRELEVGVEKSTRPDAARKALERFCAPLVIVPFDTNAAQTYGNIRAHLERSGASFGHLDMLIASHAVSMGATIITNNTREFIRVPDLPVENWL